MRAERSAGAVSMLPADLITLREAAMLAGGVHPKTIRRWISLDLLGGYRRGPRLLFVSRRELLELAQPIETGGVA